MDSVRVPKIGFPRQRRTHHQERRQGGREVKERATRPLEVDRSGASCLVFRGRFGAPVSSLQSVFNIPTGEDAPPLVEENVMTDYKVEKNAMLEKEADKYTGMREMKFSLTPNVLVCAAGGGILGLILALWATGETGIVVATTIVMAILAGIFGMFL